MDQIRIRALLATFISSLVWGWAFISTKVLVNYFSPCMLGFVRYTIASLFLFFLLKLTEPKAKLKREDLFLIIITGILGISLTYYLAIIALQTITASTSGIINGTIPILTLIGEIIFLRKKISQKSIIAIILSALGVYLIVAEGFQFQMDDGFSRGYIYMLLSMVSWVAYTFITKPLFERYSSLATITYQTIFGVISFIPVVILEGSFPTEIGLIFSEVKIFGNLVFLGIFCSAIAYYAYNYGLAHLGISTTAIFMNFVPVMTMIGSYLILGEKITMVKFLGMIIVIVSVFVSSCGSSSGERVKREK